MIRDICKTRHFWPSVEYRRLGRTAAAVIWLVYRSPRWTVA